MAEVELPNPDELEEAKAKTFTRRVALTTAVYAVILAITSLGGGNATKDMMLAQQEAADQWAHYQAKNIRGHATRLQRERLEFDIADRGPAMSGEIHQKADSLLAKFAEDEVRYEHDKEEIKRDAEKLENDRDRSRRKDPYFDFAEVLLQIAIVTSSIAILSSSRHLFAFSLLLAGIGTVLSGWMIDRVDPRTRIGWVGRAAWSGLRRERSSCTTNHMRTFETHHHMAIQFANLLCRSPNPPTPSCRRWGAM